MTARRVQASHVMDHQPLLPSMSLDSFLNFVEEPGPQHADAPAKAAMLRQARLQPNHTSGPWCCLPPALRDPQERARFFWHTSLVEDANDECLTLWRL